MNLLLVSRRLTHSPNGPSVPTSPKAGAFSAPVYKSQEIPLASVVLDTLLCVLVDSIPSLRVFEDLNGVQVVVKILKRSGTPREVRYVSVSSVPDDALRTLPQDEMPGIYILLSNG